MIPKQILKKVKRIEIRTRGLVNDLFGGEYHSVFKGRGMTFSEVREYQPGDDIRLIDWNVTARTGSPFIKIFEVERELSHGEGSYRRITANYHEYVNDLRLNRGIELDRGEIINSLKKYFSARGIGADWSAIDELHNEFEGKAVIGKVNVDESASISSKYGIRNIPTLLFIKNGEIIDNHVGAVSKEDLSDKLSGIL